MGVYILNSALLLFFLHIQGIVAQQQFSVEPSDVEVTPGHNTSLTCLVNNLAGECRWQKDGKPVGMEPGKYEMRGGLGDCTLTLLLVEMKIDDGLWECQVTSSRAQAQDSLVSRKARLTVQVPPESISIQYSGNMMGEGGLITLQEDKLENIFCITRKSNPAPRISWRLGNTLLPTTSQNNQSEPASSKWRSEALLAHTFNKRDIGKRLECVVEHQAYLQRDGRTHVEVDILYKPVVRISRVDQPVLEEGLGSVSLTCQAEANPPARVYWRLEGSRDQPQQTETLQLSPVTRRNAGTYVCHAENSIGKSEEERTLVSILYPPQIQSVVPRERADVRVNNRTVLTCKADANPEPRYQWLQMLPSSQQEIQRSTSPELVLDSVAYTDQGDYVCQAFNTIGGEKRVARSGVVRLEVAGAPLVSRSVQEVVAVSGRDVSLEAEFCSDPVPLRNTWEWGSVVLPAGSELGGKYRAELVEHPQLSDCYLSRLTLVGVGQVDSRSYVLSVENLHGTDKVPMNLIVRDPVPMTAVIGVVIALLIAFVLLSIFFLVAYKQQRLCFKDGDLEKIEGSPRNGDYIPYSGQDVKETATIKQLPPSTKV